MILELDAKKFEATVLQPHKAGLDACDMRDLDPRSTDWEKATMAVLNLPIRETGGIFLSIANGIGVCSNCPKLPNCKRTFSPVVGIALAMQPVRVRLTQVAQEATLDL